ncbi:MAG TPA: CBS domain-containing protein [Anaerolineae bacterium]|nr:CBS domain-containing protein [Anaerolineae bacterium]
MAFLSELLGKPVTDLDGNRLGNLDDVIAGIRGELPHPALVAIVVKRSHGQLLIPFSDVAVLIAPAIPLNRQLANIVPYQPAENDLFLARDVLDKQIIDTNGVRVVRVNDLELTRIGGSFYLANVDVGGLGLLRRLGLAKTAERFVNRLGRSSAVGMISWHQVEMLPGDQPMRLRVPGDKLSELHPADLAEIISDLSPAESDKLLESLDVKTLADTLEEVEPDFQASLVEDMSDERVADVLEEMSPDEAADLLAELPEDRSHDLLNLMQRDEANDVRKLLTYHEESAGGIMNTEFIAMQPDLTAEQAISVLRETAAEAETIYYIYVIDDDQHLNGVFSLRELVLAKPDTPITQFMHRRVITVGLQDSQEEVAQAISKYNLVAVPVVDDQNRLHGIVTADDALDKIIPTAWKKRLPRLYH